jgi:hypothetical protein
MDGTTAVQLIKESKMNIINLSRKMNCAYIKIENNGAHAVYKPNPRQGGELFCGFKPCIGDTESLERALKYVGATKSETEEALSNF